MNASSISTRYNKSSLATHQEFYFLFDPGHQADVRAGFNDFQVNE